MNWTLHFFEAEGSLAAWRDRLIDEAHETFWRIERCLGHDIEMPPVDIVVQRMHGPVIPELGIVGMTLRRRCLAITLDPNNPNFEASMNADAFSRTLTHEFHHCLRHHGVGYGMTLPEAMVSEGLADQFDREVNGGNGQIWNHALSSEQWPSMLRRAQDALQTKHYDHRLWFFGGQGFGNAEPIPRWTGYTIGYHMVAAYLEAVPEAKPSRMADTPADEVISKAWRLLCEKMSGSRTS
ncbi:DUF2268 domain-containing putative Zn-dependent protease [Microvirga pudoricolor]|uniref:DUF2268 domain-containing putative Zn-dependent protease n=1 Tax=Microvirga pudoricolor TaxID=2778729 RepID=UPI00194DEFEF|nr:DUF2268 domain-containing putative Zn-dependent protease [Microvirga pudoricolor]MBM6596747.1 hypothetical protein [Microvirga pudoricolor]